MNKTNSLEIESKEITMDTTEDKINLVIIQPPTNIVSNNLDSPCLNGEKTLVHPINYAFNKEKLVDEQQDKTNALNLISNINKLEFDHSTVQLLNTQEKLNLKICMNNNDSIIKKMPDSTFKYGQDILQNLMFSIDYKNIEQKITKLKGLINQGHRLFENDIEDKNILHWLMMGTKESNYNETVQMLHVVLGVELSDDSDRQNAVNSIDSSLNTPFQYIINKKNYKDLDQSEQILNIFVNNGMNYKSTKDNLKRYLKNKYKRQFELQSRKISNSYDCKTKIKELGVGINSKNINEKIIMFNTIYKSGCSISKTIKSIMLNLNSLNSKQTMQIIEVILKTQKEQYYFIVNVDVGARLLPITITKVNFKTTFKTIELISLNDKNIQKTISYIKNSNEFQNEEKRDLMKIFLIDKKF